jgi:hypothetical protein
MIVMQQKVFVGFFNSDVCITEKLLVPAGHTIFIQAVFLHEQAQSNNKIPTS